MLATFFRALVCVLPRWHLATLVSCISLPRTREHATRTLSTLGGVALGVAVVVAVTVVNQSIMSSFTETVRSVAGNADLQVRAGSSGLDEALLDVVRQVPGVARAARLVEQTVRVHHKAGAAETLLVLGVDLLNQDDAWFRDYSASDLPEISRDPLVFLNSPYHIVLSRSFAERLGYKLHDSISLLTPTGAHTFEIWGFIDHKGIGQAYAGAVAVMDYVAMQVAFERGRNVDQIDIAVRPQLDVNEVAQRIRRRIGAAFAVVRPERRGQRVEKMLGSLSSGLNMASLVALLVGMFLIYSTMSMSVVQRRREIGVLRALGMTRRQVLGLFTTEGAIIGVVGSGLGLAFGAVLSRFMLASVHKTVGELFAQIALPGQQSEGLALVWGFCLGVGTSVLASCIPAWRAAGVDASEVLASGRFLKLALRGRWRYVSEIAAVLLALASSALLRVPAYGGVPVAASLACLGIVLSGALAMPRFVELLHRIARHAARSRASVPVTLGIESLVRDVGRVSSAASALMVGVAMSLAFASFVESFTSSTLTWVDQMLPADLWISSSARMAGGHSVPMSDSLYAELSALPGVELVERVRMADIDYRGTPVKLIAVDSAVFGDRAHMMMIEGSEHDAKEGLRTGQVVISENLARRFDLKRNAAIELAAGGATRRFRVAAVIIEYTSDQGSILVERETYAKFWQDTRVDSYKLFLKKGAHPHAVRRKIAARWSKNLELSILTQREFRVEIRALLGQTFGVMHVLELVAIVIAVLGVINAVLASVLDRTREYGLLRAIGMLRSQVRSMVVLESALIGAAGAMLGVILGSALGYVLLVHINVAQTGWYLPYRPSLGAALLAAVPVVLAAACAGWYPASLAAKKPVASSVAHE